MLFHLFFWKQILFNYLQIPCQLTYPSMYMHIVCMQLYVCQCIIICLNVCHVCMFSQIWEQANKWMKMTVWTNEQPTGRPHHTSGCKFINSQSANYGIYSLWIYCKYTLTYCINIKTNTRTHTLTHTTYKVEK